MLMLKAQRIMKLFLGNGVFLSSFQRMVLEGIMTRDEKLRKVGGWAYFQHKHNCLIYQDSLEAPQVGESVQVSAGAAGQRGHVRGSDLWCARPLSPVDLARSPPGGRGPGQDLV